MKNLSDFTGEEAIELWAELYDQFEELLTDKEIIAVTTGGKIDIRTATKIAVKNHRNALLDIFDKLGEEIDGANLFPAVVTLLTEMIFGGRARAFFKSAAPEKSDAEYSGKATGTLEDAER